MNQELLRIVDGIARDKNIDREVVFADLDAAMLSAVRKAHASTDEAVVRIDRGSGDITAMVNGKPLDMRTLSRIAAQICKQVIIQKLREAERSSIFDEYVARKGQIVSGRTSRWEGGALVVDLDRAEAILPKSEQIPGETHMPDERILALVLDVREQGSQVRIILSRTHPDFIRRLFEREVPEVAEKIIELKALAREAGYRTKVAVASLDAKVDAVGACVGVRGSRIKNIVDEVAGEKIDIVRWNESSKILIANALKPAEVADIALCFELGRATVVVNEDQLSLAIGKRGQNVRLAARLTTWDIDILTPAEFNAGLDTLEKTLREVEGVDSQLIDQVIALGMVNVLDVEEVGREVGVEPFVQEMGLDHLLARRVIDRCSEEARRVAAEQARQRESGDRSARGRREEPAPDGQAPEPAPSEAAPSESAPSELAPSDAAAEAGEGPQTPQTQE